MTTTNKNIEKIIEDNMMEYSSYVLLQRAIPDIRDGFKPVYRRILYGMYLLNATRLTKSATISGKVMQLHPHGSTYGTMVGMAQKDRHALPLVIGKGNFGNYTSRDLEYAADRYTEAKLSEISIDIMKDLNKNVVDFVDNYDGTLKMPSVLPVHFPAILIYAQSGIGVGFSCSMPSFNINEVCDATIKHIKGEDLPILIPDFATGGYVINEPSSFEKINKLGSGAIVLRGKAEILKNEIIITEIPYTTTREAIIEKIISLAKTEKLKEVTNVNDLTGLSGMEISITARRGTDMELLLNKLYALTPLQDTHNSNMNVLIEGLPRVLGVHDIISEWVKWRKEVVRRGIRNELVQMKDKLHVLKGLEKVLLDIDKAIELIRFSSEEKIEPNLMKYFKIDEIQAKYVSEMKLRNINKEYIINRIQAIAKFEEDIKKNEQTLESDFEIGEIIVSQLNKIKEKFGVARRTEIINAEIKQIQKAVKAVKKTVENYPVKLYLTKDGYVYKFKNLLNEPNLKPGDEILQIFETENNSELLIFTEDILCYKYPVYKIEETRANSIGTYIPQLVKEKINIINYSILDSKNKMILMAYKNNKIAKIDITAYNGNRKILKKAFNLKQELVEMITLENDVKIKITTSKKQLEIDTCDLNLAEGRLATGVYVTRSGELQKVEVV